MPAAVASRARDGAPPAKKTKLNSLRALAAGTPPQKPAAVSHRATKARKDRLDEATAVVGRADVEVEDAGTPVIDISSADEESAQASDDDNDGNLSAEPDELSFGDRLRAQDPEPVQESRVVDVESAFAGPNATSKALATAATSRPLSAPNASSLGTVLTQALRTNDTELLESCLRVIDVDTIYATVERLPSPLVATLLQKLAERLHKKPGRAGMLMVWVQWSLAAHGGYLASQPQLVRQLTTLNKVLKERASGLQPLLSLKGRLDMLQAQLELRRRNQRRAANDDEDEAVIYVEGEDDYVSSVEGDDPDVTQQTSGLQKRIRGDVDDDDEDESSIDEMPTTMELDDESEEQSEDSEALIDDEAEETDDDLGDDMSEPTSDGLGNGEGLSESEQESKPERRSTAARSGLKGRR